MASLHNSNVGSSAPKAQRRQPQLPAFCRTRLPTVTVRVTTLQRLHWLLWLAVALQLSTLLLLAGPIPPRLKPRPALGSGPVAAACEQRQSSAAVPSLYTS
jgi:hypothetical protein